MQGPSVFHILAAAVCMSVCICVFVEVGCIQCYWGRKGGVWGWKCGPSVIGSEPNVTLCVSLCLCDAEEYKYSPLSVLTHTRTHSFPLQTYELSSQRRSCVLNFVQVGCSWEDCKFLTKTLRKQLVEDSDASSTCSRFFFNPSWLWTPAFLQQGVSSLLCRQRKGQPRLEKKNTEHRIWRKRGHTHADLSHDGLQDLRLKVNGRERKRMHDLNQAIGWAPSGDVPYSAGARRTQAVQNLHPASRQRTLPSSCSPALWRRWRS